MCDLNSDDVVLSRKEDIKDFWIELRSASFTHDGEAFFQRKRRLVRPLAAEGIEHIRHGCDPSFNGNVLACEAEWLASAVPALVMGQCDFHPKFQNR